MARLPSCSQKMGRGAPENEGIGAEETMSGFKLRPSIGWIFWPASSVGYLAPARSTQVAMMSIKWAGSLDNLPLSPSLLPAVVIPAGQWTINGVEMPPSCPRWLYSGNGVFLT